MAFRAVWFRQDTTERVRFRIMLKKGWILRMIVLMLFYNVFLSKKRESSKDCAEACMRRNLRAMAI